MNKLFPDLLKLYQLSPVVRYNDYNTVRFYSHRTDDNKYWNTYGVQVQTFSNLYPCVIEIEDTDGHMNGRTKFQSTEHYFQMYKYSEGDRNVMQLLKTNEVAMYGQRRLKIQHNHLKMIQELGKEKKEVPKKKNGCLYELNNVSEPVIIVEDWDTKKIYVMLTALRAKYSQNKVLGDMLLATKGCWLVEHTKKRRTMGRWSYR